MNGLPFRSFSQASPVRADRVEVTLHLDDVVNHGDELPTVSVILLLLAQRLHALGHY